MASSIGKALSACPSSIDKWGNKIPSQNRTGYLSSPPPRPQSGEEIPVASSIPQSIFLHKTRQYFMWPCGLLGNHQTISGRGGAPGTSPHLMHEFTQRYK